MTARQNGAKAGAAVDDVREDLAATRDDLGNTVEALADKADVKGRAKRAARKAKAKAREGTEDAVEQVRRRPGWLATAGAGVVAAATAVGVLRWRRNRQKPQNRAKRMWRSVSDRFTR